MNFKEKIKKKKIAGKNHSVLEGLKGGPFEDTETFSSSKCFNFFFNMHKECIFTNSKSFSQKCAVIKKKEIIDRKVFKL